MRVFRPVKNGRERTIQHCGHQLVARNVFSKIIEDRVCESRLDRNPARVTVLVDQVARC